MQLQGKVRSHLLRTTRSIARSNLNALRLPESILIIPDGNARWARTHNRKVAEGHMSGASAVGIVLEELMYIKTRVIGIWGFSEDNWKRPEEEIQNIFKVIHYMVESNLPKFQKNGVKFLCLGKRERLKKEFPMVLKAIEDAEKKTAKNTQKVLALFIDYGERYQLEEFAKARLSDKKSSTYQILSKINKGLPLFELVIRTSGEQRLSGFGPLASLAEFAPIKKNLPDLGITDFIRVLRDFAKRERRFGGREEKTEKAYGLTGGVAPVLATS